MKRRLNMALPLIFAFVLTLLPFGLLEYNQHQRDKIQREREITRWEQQAGNYLQMFRSIWSIEAQINRRLFLFYKKLIRYQKGMQLDSTRFMHELRSCFPQRFMPTSIYAGLAKSNGSGVEMLTGDGYAISKQRFFKRFLDAFCRPVGSYDSSELSRFNAMSRGAFGDILDFELLRNDRAGKVSSAVHEGRPVLVVWDSVKLDNGQRVVYLMLFPLAVIDRLQALEFAANMLGSKYDQVSSVLVPLRHARADLDPVFDHYLSDDQRNTILQCLDELDGRGISRDSRFPPGRFDNYQGVRIMREFIDYAVPYELWITSRGEIGKKHNESFLSFVLRLFFYTAWILVFARVLISGNPIGIRLQTWLTLTFMVVGILPLLVFYVAGLFHIDSAAFRREQEAIKNATRQLEEADASGEALLADYHNFCQQIESDPEWVARMTDWNKASWDSVIEKLPAKFAASGLNIDAVYVFPPDTASVSGCVYSFPGAEYSPERERVTFDFYGNWIRKSYFIIASSTMIGEEPDLQMFKGRSGKEMMRYFLSNRGDIEFVDFSEDKYFIYQNFLLRDGLPCNWYFFRIGIARAFEKYLREAVYNLQYIFADNIYAIARIDGARSNLLFPPAQSKEALLLHRVAGHLIELVGVTRTSQIEQTEDHLLVVYPCVRSGPFILANMVFFKNFRIRAYRQEMLLSFIVVLMAIPVFLISRLTAAYLVRPLLDVEDGLNRISADDFSRKLSLQRDDELGRLSNAFDQMVAGIRERRNLGRFVSASLDQQVAVDDKAGHKSIEGRFGAVLCSDIRSFTTMSESYPVREIVAMLNEHLATMSSCIKEHGGMVEQFVGDAIIAIFYGESLGEAAEKSVKAAQAMLTGQQQIIQQRRQQGKFVYEFGIGIEVGYLLSGTVKAGTRYEYLFVGDARTRAEALEALSKEGRHTKIMVSEKIFALTHGLFVYEKVPDLSEYELVKARAEDDL